ncbi:hypothetical protein GALMADRAFT_233820 [Galerina marginata CBS 339.88]|uniref:Uncharacterized protein n=1 Tax=Galerina marginata (strain CBS 339.88) TaxID=685588 RepID=A0A067TYS7_GALM3|nr:hypothetical protein GALMADRAFT_233820 [Galerina marginata CBS 339.88]
MSSPPASSETTESSQVPQESPSPASDSTPQDNDNAEPPIEKPLHSPRPLRKYTRQQLVSLSSSPLVKPPPNMPELKVWFGSENENPLKKDEPPTPGATRERRFRRDTEDGGDAPARPTFRTALTQPSQMGNFKHQSLRANDRDKERERERDGEKEREREIREKEGHERLRHLSDKFDRDRLALPLANARKEREAAPHLNANNSRPTQTLTSNAASRRAETREATKKKVGEASEDWRRGAEPPRSTRDDRNETGRREDKDRARSRARDSSRPKREASISRRERDEKAPRGDRERDDHRRDKDDARRDRDVDVEDDPRRWRDDGKRDERMAVRRDRDRGRDKAGHDQNWEGTTDKRWTGDERDGRYKRSSARDRKSGNTGDDTKEKEERREKEREKEPAWMDTYVPSDTSPGILGGQSSTGELDGIQAWKKGMKEKEEKEKDSGVPDSSKDSGIEKEVSSILPETAERPPMDEIQIFKLLMKKEEEKKKTDVGVEAAVKNEHTTLEQPKREDATSSMQQRPRNPDNDSPGDSFPSEAIRKGDLVHSQVQNVPPPTMDSSLETPFPIAMKDPLAPGKLHPGMNPSPDNLLQAKPPAPSGADLSHLGPGKLSGDSETTNFHPPPGSRLLAFARPPVKGGTSSNPVNSQVLNSSLPNIVPEPAQGYVKHDPIRPLSGFSPFEDQTRQVYAFDNSRESGLAPNLNLHPRTNTEAFNSNLNPQVEPNYNGMAAVKGSRFAKFFDGKGRDGLPSSSKTQPPGGFTSPSPNHNQRQEQVSLVTGNSGDQRAMDELFAMLNNSSQRGNLGHHSNSNSLLNNNGAFGSPGPSLNVLQQQHLLQQQSQHHNRLEPRLESLYDSRADDRSFVPDGMVPGLRPMPPPARGRDGHFVEQVDEQMHYNFQRIPQQTPLQQARNIDSLYSGPGPLFGQQGGRPTGGLNLQSLQQPHYRGGPSPLNQGGPLPSSQQQQRLPPGLANLGGRPPHEPSQFLGLPGLPSNAPHNNLHANGPLPPQQLPFNNFNGVNNINFNGSQVRVPVPGPNFTSVQQHPLGNLGHPNMDPRLSNHHHLMGLGGSGVSGNRINGGFPQQGPTGPSHITMRQQQQQPHLPPHMLPHIMPPHLQQGHPSNNPPNPDLMALLLGGSHRE